MPEPSSATGDLSQPKPIVRVEAWTFDVGDAGKSVKAFAEAAIHRVETAWDGGADIVLMPEYLWAGLEPLLPANADMNDIAKVVWSDVMPVIQQRLQRPGKHAVLGTTPWVHPDTHQLRNRAIVVSDGRLLHQDKLFLTPWEHEFTAGRELYVFNMAGLKVAVIICLDIEVPEISARLRGLNIDLLLVPTATESPYGSERVTRCASARAVELGCAVVVCPLVGKCDSSMVNVNLGRMASYLPAEKTFDTFDRTDNTRMLQDGWHLHRLDVPVLAIREARERWHETNPAQLSVNLTPDEIVFTGNAAPTAHKAVRKPRL